MADSPLHTAPDGLIDQLGLRTTGRQPTEFGGTVVPMLDVSQQYMAGGLRIVRGLTTGVTIDNTGQTWSLVLPQLSWLIAIEARIHRTVAWVSSVVTSRICLLPLGQPDPIIAPTLAQNTVTIGATTVTDAATALTVHAPMRPHLLVQPQTEICGSVISTATMNNINLSIHALFFDPAFKR